MLLKSAQTSTKWQRQIRRLLTSAGNTNAKIKLNRITGKNYAQSKINR